MDPSNSPDEDERSFNWAVDEDAPASPVPDAEERASTKPETEQRMDNAGRQPALASPKVIEPSPAISQISTFTNHTLSHYLDYYLQNDEAGDTERTDAPEVEYRPRSSRRPSTAPAAQRISQLSGLPTTFESGAVASPSHGSHEPSQRKQGPAKGTTHGEGNSQPRASRSALANDFASQTPSVQSGAMGRREKRAPRDLLDKSE
ncbi:hypothetical protein FRC01_014260 [Tulasnella sp. 417]|nr:hypothetical protein FRC01_014260 [Tulasnella sp. 417]